MRCTSRWILGAVLLATSACSGTESEMSPLPVEGLRPINGTELFVKEVGAGDPLLVVHGGPGMEHSYLLPGLDVLSGDARLVFYDQRGGGRSLQVEPESISFEGFLEDLDGVRASTGRDRVDVLAHSWGGLLGLLYAARYPEHVRSLILVGSVEPGQRFAAQAAQRGVAARTAEDVALVDSLVKSSGFAARDPGTVSELYWAALRPTFADRTQADRLVINFTELTARRGGDVAAALMTPLGAFDFWTEIAEIQAPVLIVHGDSDPTPMEMAEALRDAVSAARLLTIDGAGHLPFLERPEVFRQGVSAFLASLADGR